MDPRLGIFVVPGGTESLTGFVNPALCHFTFGQGVVSSFDFFSPRFPGLCIHGDGVFKLLFQKELIPGGEERFMDPRLGVLIIPGRAEGLAGFVYFALCHFAFGQGVVSSFDFFSPRFPGLCVHGDSVFILLFREELIPCVEEGLMDPRLGVFIIPGRAESLTGFVYPAFCHFAFGQSIIGGLNFFSSRFPGLCVHGDGVFKLLFNKELIPCGEEGLMDPRLGVLIVPGA